MIVSRLLSPDQPLVVPIDDTLTKRRGRKVFGCFWHHDATANSSKGSLAWGTNWVTAGINVKLPFLERTVCLLVLFRLWRPRRKEIPKHKPDPERPSKPRLAREILYLLAARFKDRRSISSATPPTPRARSPACLRTSRSLPGCVPTPR